MRKVLHKVKSQWIVLGVLGATVVSLGTADVRQVSASEIEGASASEPLAARELGTADVSVEAAEKAAHVGLDHAISTATTDGTATVFVHWNEDETITVTVKDLNGSVLYSDLLVDSEGENTVKVLTANQDYYTIKIAVKAAATEQTTTATEPIELAVPEVLAEVEAPEEVAAEENDYAKIVSTTEVDYPAVIARATDAINTAPWGVEGYQTLASSADYAGKTVDVTKEQVTDYGVTWALVSLNGKELGWIAKDALTVQTYAAITSETIVDYPATISRGTDAINLAPWGTRGYQTISSSATYVGKTVNVIKEQTTDYGVTWAQISLNGEVLGWIAKDALTAQTYAAVVSETEVDYPATVNRDSDAINTAPWGVKGYQTLSSSAAYVGQTVEVIKEQVTDYGVTWAQISLNGEVLGWIAKDALKIQTYAQITKETAVDYSATISRDSDAINTAPWGVKGYQTLSSSAAYVGQTVEVTKEQVTDYGVTWALVSQNGKALGWIAKDALKVQTYAQITKETAVSYDAIVNRDSDAINTAPWGVKGYQTLSSSAAFVGQTVEVTKEQVTDYGVTWALVSQNGKELGWIAKDALKVQTYAQIVSENEVAYPALINRGTDAINTSPWGTKGYQTNASSADYLGQAVEVTKEQTTDYGVTWALVSLNGKELGWIAKDALIVMERTMETVVAKENTVAYQTVTEEDNTIPTGESQVAQAGADGYDTVTYDVTYVNGVETNRLEVNRSTTAPMNEIVKVGTQVTEVKTKTTNENEVAFTTIEEEDNTIPVGERVVVQAGVKGYDTVMYDVTYVNGVETNRVEISRATTAPVSEIVKVGTQVTEVKSEMTTENEVGFATVEEEDNTIPVGERVVVQAGAKGYDTVMFDVTYVNGIETNRVEVRRTTTAPVSEVVKVGTQVTEVKSETTTENEVTYATVEEFDNTIPTGDRAVVQAGVKGYDTVTYDVTYVNGIETKRVEVSRSTTAPVSEIVKVGTQVTEVKSETTTENEVAFATVEEEDNTIPIGERVVVQAGVKGYDTVTFDVTYVNGVETNRVEVSRTTTAPVAEVVKAGTQVTEVKSETTTENEVAYSTIEEFDNTIPTGERIVVQTGVKGYDTVSYDVTYVNGIETNRVEVSRSTTAPVTQIVKVGTQVTEVKSETTIENEVSFTTIEDEDNTIPTGERVVVQTGVSGYDTVTYNVTYVNGVETNRVEVSRMTSAPVTEMVKVGSQVIEIKRETATENTIAYNTLSLKDNTIPNGETELVQEGSDGYDAVTYEVTYINGVEANRVETDRDKIAAVNKIIRVGTQVVEVKYITATEKIVSFETIEQNDDTYPTGQTEEMQAGMNGYDTVSYEVTYTNGIETSRTETGRTTIAAVPEIIRVGSQVIEIKRETATENKIAYNTILLKDNTIPAGETELVQEGFDGYDVVTYEVTYINGVESNRVESDRDKIAAVNEITRIGTQVVEVKHVTATEKVVSFETVEQNDDTYPTGQTEEMQAGMNGYDTVSYEVTYTNGIETSRIEIGRITTEPVNKIVRVGIQVTETKAETALENTVAYGTIEQPDDNFLVGQTEEIQAGTDGYDMVTYEVTYINGVETSRVESSRITTAPTKRIVKVGTQSVEIVLETISENIMPFETIEQEDDTIPVGEKSIVQAGVDGYNRVTYEVMYVNGVETTRVEVSREEILSVSQIVKVGTQGAVKSIALTTVGDTSVVLNGKTLQINAVVNPEDATEASVVWSVEAGTGTATIDESGLLTATSSGTVTVRATAKDAYGAFGIKELTIAVPIMITGYTGMETSIEIPDMIMGHQIDQDGDYNDFNISENLDSDEIGIVTGIGAFAFNSNYLSQVVIPDTVTQIGSYAFSDNELIDIVIPDSVTQIGSYAFDNNNLSSIVIPDSVIRIGAYAFNNNKLVNVEIGNGVVNIGDGAFSGEPLVSTVGNSTGTNQIFGNQISSLILGNNIIDIGDGAFSNNKLSSLIIPESVVNIGDLTFSGNQLTSIIIPNSVTNIGTYAFRFNNLSSINIGENVISIGAGAFRNNQLTSVVIPDSVAIIGADAFRSDLSSQDPNKVGNAIYDVTLGSGVASIGDYAFYGNKLTDIDIPESVTTLGDSVFGYNMLTNIEFPGNITNMGNNVFAGNQLASVIIQEGITTLGNGTFRQNKLSNVIIPDSLTNIGDFVFSGNLLTSVTIPEGVTIIGNSAFSENRLSSVTIPIGVTSIGDWAFGGNQLTNVLIPESVTSIGNGAFSNNQLTSVIIPEGIISIGDGTFRYNQLTNVYIPNSVTSIGSGAFTGNQLTSVVIPEGVTNIGNSAFSGNRLTKVVIPEGVTKIENSTFNGNQITSVVIPVGVTSIGDAAFSGNRLTSIIIPEGVTTIGSSAFGANQLTGVIIPESVTSIGSYAFNGNPMTYIWIGEGVQLGDNSFAYNTYFRDAYAIGGAGVYTGSQYGSWTKAVEETVTEQSTEVIPFGTEQIENPTLPFGETQVLRAGVVGSAINIYNVTYAAGIEINRELISSEVTGVPANEIVAVGTGTKIDVSFLSVSQKEAIAGDEITISIKIESGVQIKQVELDYIEPVSGGREYLYLSYNEATGLYETTKQISDSQDCSGEWKIDSIHVMDAKFDSVSSFNKELYFWGNAEDLSAGNFTVTGTNPDIEKPVIDLSTLTVTQTGTTAGNTVTVSVKVTDNVGINSVGIMYIEPTTQNQIGYNLYYSEESGMYVGTKTIDENDSSGEWKVASLYASDNARNNESVYSGNSVALSNGDFTVSGTTPDKEAPIVNLESLHVSAKEVIYGDTVTIGILATDASGVINGNVSYAKLVNGYVNQTESIQMVLNAETGYLEADKFISSIDKNEGVFLYSIGLYDKYGNSKYLYNQKYVQYGNAVDLSGAEYSIVASKENVVLETKTVVKEESVRYFTESVSDPNYPSGIRWVIKEGREGTANNSYEVYYHDGVEVGSILVAQEIIQQPVSQQVVYGANYDNQVFYAETAVVGSETSILLNLNFNLGSEVTFTSQDESALIFHDVTHTIVGEGTDQELHLFELTVEGKTTGTVFINMMGEQMGGGIGVVVVDAPDFTEESTVDIVETNVNVGETHVITGEDFSHAMVWVSSDKSVATIESAYASTKADSEYGPYLIPRYDTIIKGANVGTATVYGYLDGKQVAAYKVAVGEISVI